MKQVHEGCVSSVCILYKLNMLTLSEFKTIVPAKFILAIGWETVVGTSRCIIDFVQKRDSLSILLRGTVQIIWGISFMSNKGGFL